MRNPRLVNGRMVDLTDEAADHYDNWLSMKDRDVEDADIGCVASTMVYAVLFALAVVILYWA